MAFRSNLFALVALLPAAANPALLARAEGLAVTLCGGGSISIPLNSQPPSPEGPACCNKGCHGSEKRKRAKTGNVDPTQ